MNWKRPEAAPTGPDSAPSHREALLFDDLIVESAILGD